MNRKFKLLPLTFGLILTMGIAASSAMAAVEFHSGATNTNLTAAQEGTNVLVIDSGTFHCTTATFSGSQTAKTAAAVEVAPTYAGCKTTGFIEANATVDTNGCKYNLAATSSASMVHITGCNAGAPGIVMTLPFCTITITPQTIGPVDYATAGTAGTTHEVVVNWTVANIAYHESGFACKNSGSSTTGGQYTGNVRVTGVDAATGNHVGITVE